MILALTSNARCPHSAMRALRAEARERDEEVVFTDPRRMTLTYKGDRLPTITVPSRGEITPHLIFHWLRRDAVGTLLDVLDTAGFYLVNPLAAVRAGRDKSIQLAAFDRHRVPHPWTVYTRGGWTQVEPHLNWQGDQYVIKPHNSGRGRLVKRAADPTELERLFDDHRRYRQGALVQEYIDQTEGPRHHYRVNVVGGKVVAAGRLVGTPERWVTNSARGGVWEEYPDLMGLPKEVARLGVRAAGAIGAVYSGVDIIGDDHGRFYVLEANENPGFGADSMAHLARLVVDIARARRLDGRVIG